jgi:hypothetical protein
VQCKGKEKTEEVSGEQLIKSIKQKIKRDTDRKPQITGV